MESVLKSHYKRKCKACGKIINRGDLITRSWNVDGMKLRCVTRKEGFYTRYTGNYIFHRDCYMPGVWTDYQAEIYADQENEYQDENYS